MRGKFQYGERAKCRNNYLCKRRLEFAIKRQRGLFDRFGDELAQMNEKLEAVQTEYTTIAAGMSDRVLPLKILQAISEKITPEQKIRLNNISMSPESVRLAGVAPSFESVDNLMSVLRQVTEFKNIEVLNTDVDTQSKVVRFALSITTVLK